MNSVEADEELDRYGFWAVAAADPNRVAIIDAHGDATSFGALADTADSVARGLRTFGLERGDGVVAVLPNGPEFFVVYLAAMASGLYMTPVNSHLAGPEVAYVVNDCEADALFVHADLIALVAGVPADDLPDACVAVPEAAGFRSLADLVSLGMTSPALPDGIGAGATMMYTSGTTGRPKGVRRSLPALDANTALGRAAHLYCRGFGVTPGPGTHLVCGPLYHAGPFSSATSALHVGNTVVLLDRWTPEGCLRAIEQHRVTNTQMVPTMFHRLLALPDDVKASHDVSSVQSVMHTGAPCPAHVKSKFMDWFGPVIYETYGGTESVATIATPRRWLQKPGTVGRAIHGVTLHILDDAGAECGPGEVGAIYIENENGPTAEYFKDPDKTADMRKGEWVTLGDVGFLDDDGYLFLRDRTVDMVISGGVNIYPAEIESVLLECELVADVAVIGVPDDEWGESVLAIVELADGIAPDQTTERAVIEFCDGRLARFKTPRRVDFVEDLPRLPNGKVQKRTLRIPYWDHVERAI